MTVSAVDPVTPNAQLTVIFTDPNGTALPGTVTNQGASYSLVWMPSAWGQTTITAQATNGAGLTGSATMVIGVGPAPAPTLTVMAPYLELNGKRY